MASIRKRGDRWQAQVKVGSRRKAKTFSTKAAAVAWARGAEIELENAIAGKIPNKTLHRNFVTLRFTKSRELHRYVSSGNWRVTSPVISRIMAAWIN